jgi:putative ABC transport system permease protein
MTSAPQPPRLARLLVRARLRGGERTDVESDLAELFEERVERLDLHRARRRYWRDAISLWLQPRRATILRTPTSHGVRRRPMLGADIRWAWRSIRSRPTASIAVVVVLAVGVGLAAAMFALADPYVLRALPYPRPSELVLISPHDPLPTIQKGKLVEPTDNLTVADWRARVHLFSAMAGIGDRHTIQVDRNGVLTTLRTADVSAGFFAIMGLPMPSGVPWRVAPDQHAERPIAIVDDHATQIGMPLTSPDGERWRVAVLLPATFVFPQASGERVTALVPLADEHIQHVVHFSATGTATSMLTLLARLAPGVTAEQADAAVAPPPGATPPGFPTRRTVERLSDVMTSRTRALALGAAIAGLLIFLTSAANIANLLAARGASRLREFGARQAMGATRVDLARLVLVELAGLTMAAVAIGLALAAATLKLLAVVMPADYAALGAPAVGGREIVFAAAIGVVVMVTGLAPAWIAWRVNASALVPHLVSIEGRQARTLRFALTAGQAAVAMVLLMGGALLLRSYARLLNQDTGFAPDASVLTTLYPQSSGSARSEHVSATLARLRFIPGISHPAAILGDLGDDVTGVNLELMNGRLLRTGGRALVTADYALATGARLIAGRFFTDADADHALVVNEAFAKLCCPDRSALGAILAAGTPDQRAIVGVMADALDSALDHSPVPRVFQPLDDTPYWGSNGIEIHYVFRASGATNEWLPLAERAVLDVDSSSVVTGASTIDARLFDTVRDRSFSTLVVVLFGITTIVVSATGLIGIVGFSVARRTREIAVRMAIGARARDVRWLVAREAVLAAIAGAIGGLAAGAWLSGTLTHLLFGIPPQDPMSFAAAVLVMAVVVAGAASIPASRALRIDPCDALRSE